MNNDSFPELNYTDAEGTYTQYRSHSFVKGKSDLNMEKTPNFSVKLINGMYSRARISLADYDNDNDLDIFFCLNEIERSFPFSTISPQTVVINDSDFSSAYNYSEHKVLLLEDGDTINPVARNDGFTIKTGDINNDGNIDFCLWQLNKGSNYCTGGAIYKSNGNGNFSFYKRVNPFPTKNVIGEFCDLNNDSLMDIVMHVYGKDGVYYPGAVYIMWGDTDDFIECLAPNGGKNITRKTTLNISWRDNINDSVRIELLSESTVAMVISSSTESDGSFSWFIPDSVDTGNYTIKITSLGDSTVFDTSDSQFTIINFTVKLTVENGSGSGEYAIDDTVDIKSNNVPNQIFYKWTGDTESVSNIFDSVTTVTIPDSNITVKAANAFIIPGKIQAEKFFEYHNAHISIGKVVDYHTDSWTTYNIFAKYSGDYTVNFLVYSSNGVSGPHCYLFRIDSLDTTELAHFDIPPNSKLNGGIISKNISLKEGHQTLKIMGGSANPDGFGIYWLSFDSLAVPISNVKEMLPQKFALKVQHDVLKYMVPPCKNKTEQPQPIKIVLYDLRGKKIATLLKANVLPGSYSIPIANIKSHTSSGLWVVSLRNGSTRVTTILNVM